MDYTELLDSKIEGIIVPDSLHCTIQVRETTWCWTSWYHVKIPITGGGLVKTGSNFRPGCIPGWKEEVEPFQLDAKIWHAVWKSAGRPSTGGLYSIMAKSRNM